MRVNSTGEEKVYGMTTLSGILFPFLSYYMELAKNVSDYGLSDFSGNSSYAFYGNLDLTFGSLGISAEYKDYKKFLVGNAVNEPPALIREQTYKVLNRSTHVVQPSNETGYQLEAYYTFPDLSNLILNSSLAVNYFGKKTVFREFFAEYDFSLQSKHDIKLFADFAQDPFNLESDRISTGMYADWYISNSSVVYTDFEFQDFNREADKIQNFVFSAGYSFRSKIVAGFTAEASNDPYLTDKNYRTWLGVNVKYQINPANNVQLFAGQRRGGPACNAGVCYEVLDFNGVELRLNSRF